MLSNCFVSNDRIIKMWTVMFRYISDKMTGIWVGLMLDIIELLKYIISYNNISVCNM